MYYETIQIDFNSDEAIYIQLRNQIILGIATSQNSGRRYSTFGKTARRQYRNQHAYRK